MSTYDGSIRINTQLNTNGFNTGIRSMLTGLKSIVSTMGIAFSIGALVKFGKQSIELASNIAEVDNVVSKAFGNMRSEMDELASNSIKTLGMSRLMAYQTGSTFMSMGRSMLDSASDAKNMALNLTKLTANMASFFNVSQEYASIALKSIYTGETETLKQYGVVMTETNLQEFAHTKGINKKISAMTQSEKVMLRYLYVTQQLSFIGDDFVDTQDSWSNQTRILSEQWKEFMSIIGSGLITVLTPVVKVLNQIVSALINVANTIGKVMSSVFGIQAQKLGAVADSAGDAEKAIDGYGNAASEAGKKAKGSLRDIHELNNASSNSQNIKNGGGSSGTIEFDETPFDNTDNRLDELNDRIKKFADYVKKTWDNFSSGFKDAWDFLNIDAQIEDVKNSLARIKAALMDIFTDPMVLSAIDNFIQATVYSLGQMAASFISISLAIAQNILGGIAIFLEENTEKIKQYIISMFDIGTDIVTLLGNYAVAFANVFQVFASDSAKRITADIIQIFYDIFATVSYLIAALGRDLLHLFLDPFINNQIAIKSTLQGMVDVIASVTDTIAKFIRQICDGFTTLYDNHIKPFIDNFIKDLSELIAKFLELWDKYIQPILNRFAELFDTTYEKHIKPLTDNIFKIISQLIDIISELWDKCLKPLIAWIMDTMAPKVSIIMSVVLEIVTGVINAIIDLANGLLESISDVIQIIVDLLNGDFASAWTNTQNFVKHAINGILSAVESMANGVINALNAMIRGINGMSFTIPSWIPGYGGKSMSLGIPEIGNISLPRLANGGITTGSTLANIGEAGREAVLPLENNLGYLDSFAEKIASKINASFIIKPDRQRIFEIVREDAANYFNTTGNLPFEI